MHYTSVVKRVMAYIVVMVIANMTLAGLFVANVVVVNRVMRYTVTTCMFMPILLLLIWL